jgi:hypothetical protein
MPFVELQQFVGKRSSQTHKAILLAAFISVHT